MSTFLFGLLTLLRALCAMVCRRWARAPPAAAAFYLERLIETSASPGCCQDTADATEEETRQRPPPARMELQDTSQSTAEGWVEGEG